MKRVASVRACVPCAVVLSLVAMAMPAPAGAQPPSAGARLVIEPPAPARAASRIVIDQLYFETAAGRVTLPAELTRTLGGAAKGGEAKMPDGRVVRLAL